MYEYCTSPAQVPPAHVKQWVLGQALILIVSPPVLLHYSYLHPALALPGSRDLHSFAILSTLLSSPPPGTGTHLTSVPPPPPSRGTGLAVDRLKMDAGEVDWETINEQLVYQHTEEAHARRRDIWTGMNVNDNKLVIRHIYVHIYTPISTHPYLHSYIYTPISTQLYLDTSPSRRWTGASGMCWALTRCSMRKEPFLRHFALPKIHLRLVEVIQKVIS